MFVINIYLFFREEYFTFQIYIKIVIIKKYIFKMYKVEYFSLYRIKKCMLHIRYNFLLITKRAVTWFSISWICWLCLKPKSRQSLLKLKFISMLTLVEPCQVSGWAHERSALFLEKHVYPQIVRTSELQRRAAMLMSSLAMSHELVSRFYVSFPMLRNELNTL